ncbi:Hypothetical predicted protein [Podarcis lilfordi]|uniref:Secreted protein n=1 Tax=Podarcis lilfordi TaxID=74358 RepID=A0AA35PGJ3_9SAUR|nr:Hypothetical predicted protein [Podarcis lilfordi]
MCSPRRIVAVVLFLGLLRDNHLSELISMDLIALISSLQGRHKRLHQLLSNAIHIPPPFLIHFHYMYEVHLWTFSSFSLSRERACSILSVTFGFRICSYESNKEIKMQ